MFFLKHCWGIFLSLMIIVGASVFVRSVSSQETDFDPDTVLAGHTALLSSLAYSADGTRLLSASFDGTVNLWDIDTRQTIFTINLEPVQITAVAFVPNSNQFLVGANDASIRLYGDTGQELRSYTGHLGAITSLAFSSDGLQFVSGSEDREARIWNRDTSDSLFILSGHSGRIWSVDYNRNTPLVVTASEDDTAIIWNALSGQEIRTLSGHTDDINSVKFSSDGNSILTGSYDGTAKLWDTNTGGLFTTLNGHTDWVYAVNFSPSENKVVTSSWDLTTRIWNLATSQTERILQSQSSAYTANAYKPDGSQIATGNFDGIVWLWNINTQLQPTPTPSQTPTLTPTPTFTPAPAGPTPTPRPNGVVLSIRNNIKVYDDANSTTDITGQTDFDTVENRKLVVEWDTDATGVTDWHVYAQTDIYGYFYLGRTDSGSTQRFEWPGSQFVDAAQSSGPSFGKTYKFRVFGLLNQPGFNVVTHEKPVAYTLEGAASSPVFSVPKANIPVGTVLVTDDLFDTEDVSGKTDTDSGDAKALFIRWNTGTNDYWNYHVFVSVNDNPNYEFVGQTSADDVNYFRWSNIRLFDTKGVFVDGPLTGTTYKFRVFGLKGQGNDRVDQLDSVSYVVE